jgi:hypothetical protein
MPLTAELRTADGRFVAQGHRSVTGTSRPRKTFGDSLRDMDYSVVADRNAAAVPSLARQQLQQAGR